MEQINYIKCVNNWIAIKIFSGTVFAIYSSNNGKKIETNLLTTKQKINDEKDNNNHFVLFDRFTKCVRCLEHS